MKKDRELRASETSKILTLLAKKASQNSEFLENLKNKSLNRIKEYGFDPQIISNVEVITRVDSCSCGCPYPGYGIGCFISSGEGAKTPC